tara:strand:+ start:347 stop:946 length:600 start_codon:yes stop_codon:yes gene_type:complete
MYKVMFATPPLMLEKYEGGDFNQLVEYVKQIPYDGETNGPQSNLPSTNHFILDDEIFVNLREFINGCVKDYAQNILLSDQKLRITQSWINKTKTSAIHTLHYHPNSVLSGVFYFNNHSSPIEFISDRKDQFSIGKYGNEFTNNSYTVPAQESLLLLFPSYIFHRVTVNKDLETRYSMSFNTFPAYEMGFKDSMSYVKVS